MSLTQFHSVVADWFTNRFTTPTSIQQDAWPSIKAGNHTLISAPTGSGKTLAAFYASIDDLVRLGLEGKLENQTHVVYISPLKALGNDIEKNLQVPLKGILADLKEAGHPEVNITAAVRSGDTPSSARAKMLKRPPHILVTTPESLYLLLTSEGGRKMLKTVKTLIVDEIHALVGDKRGSHLSLSMERLDALTETPLQRIGLSATQKPISLVAKYLVGTRNFTAKNQADCTIVDAGHKREIDLGLVVPKSPLSAVMSKEVWDEVYADIEAKILQHSTTLIFVNTRRLAERMSLKLRERLGNTAVTAHHGSLSKEQRLDAENRLKSGSLKALVATASLEMGIDIGDIDLVVQISSPKSIAAFLQRVGRSGHTISGTPKGRIYPVSRDDLVECSAILDAVRRGELDRIVMPEKPIDVLAQQIVAEVANRDWSEKELYATYKSAYPYRKLGKKEFGDVVAMLTEGFTSRRGRRGAYLHHDTVNGIVRGRKNARLTALLNGGAIPDTFDYDVILEPSSTYIGSINEDFAIESMPGDIFQLGQSSWRVEKVENGKVRVSDAGGQPPSIPFWLGEAPGRTDELSMAVARLRKEVDKRIADPTAGLYVNEQGQIGQNASTTVAIWGKGAMHWLMSKVGLNQVAAEQLVIYLAATKMALGDMPTRDTLVMERFFDEAGDMHVVLHSPFGSRLNRAWGLALRKRFCRNFNFELQAAATEDAIVLSLGATHSFQLDEVFDYLHPKTVREVLVQAMLDAPMFEVRWRWNASRALAIQRRRAGKRVPAQLQRMDAEDLVALVFPDQLACLENIAGDREVPNHPLVNQTLHDCLTEAMDIDLLEGLVKRIVERKVKLVAKDLTEPSPLAQEVINVKPFGFLDDAPLEERRTNAIRNRRWLDPAEAADLGKLDPQAIERVKEEAWPLIRSVEELHEALFLTSFFTAEDTMDPVPAGAEPTKIEKVFNGYADWFAELQSQGRAAVLDPGGDHPKLWVAVERFPEFQAVFPGIVSKPKLKVPARFTQTNWDKWDALKAILRNRLEHLGPVTAVQIAASMGLPLDDIQFTLISLESEGFIFRGQFTPDSTELEWCERRVLAKINKYTLKRLRNEIKPVSKAEYVRFLFEWHRLDPEDRPEGPNSLAEILNRLEGYEAPAAAWEGEILPARLKEYDPVWLDVLCLSGRVVWGRLSPPMVKSGLKKAGPIRTTPVMIVDREHLETWQDLERFSDVEQPEFTPDAATVLAFLKQRGACFFDDIARGTRMLKTRLERAMGELVNWGLISSDSFTGLRALITPSNLRPSLTGKKGRNGRRAVFGMEHAGRWSLLTPPEFEDESDEMPVNELEHIARVLLKRYGVVFRALTDREDNLPSWRELVRVFRLMEARGEVRGGRFVDGIWGEQYALTEAVGAMRKVRKKEKTGSLVSLSAADPLNLVGVLLPGKKIPAYTGNRILFRDGTPIAVLQGGEVKFLVEMETGEKWELQKELVNRKIPPMLKAYLGK